MLFQAVGFEMLYQESKPVADKVNTTADGIKSSVIIYIHFNIQYMLNFSPDRCE